VVSHYRNVRKKNIYRTSSDTNGYDRDVTHNHYTALFRHTRTIRQSVPYQRTLAAPSQSKASMPAHSTPCNHKQTSQTSSAAACKLCTTLQRHQLAVCVDVLFYFYSS